MFRPDDPLSPPKPHFDEPWQAQALALAEALVTAGQVSAEAWAEALGAALARAEAAGQPDTQQTYFEAVVAALEEVAERATPISRELRNRRRAAWEAAYRRTPHGQPVALLASDIVGRTGRK